MPPPDKQGQPIMFLCCKCDARWCNFCGTIMSLFSHEKYSPPSATKTLI